MTYEQAAEILGVDPDEEDEALLRKAFRKQSLLHHPDKNPGDPTATARFQNIGQALEMLMRRARGKASDEEGDDPFGDDFFRGATQDFDDEEAFGDFVRMIRDFMKMRTRGGMGVHVGGGLFFNFGHGPSDSDYDSEDQGYSRDYEKERFDDKARNMWLKREEYAAQDELDRDERRAQREARQAEVEANKKVKKQRKETARTRFATRLGVAPDGKLRYLDWSFSAFKGEADKRKLKRSKLGDGATLAHLLLDDDERQAMRKKKSRGARGRRDAALARLVGRGERRRLRPGGLLLAGRAEAGLASRRVEATGGPGRRRQGRRGREAAAAQAQSADSTAARRRPREAEKGTTRAQEEGGRATSSGAPAAPRAR
jgi:curved DNA-binding protein CbpA